MTIRRPFPLGWLHGPISGPLAAVRSSVLVRRTAPSAVAALLGGSHPAWQLEEQLRGGSDTAIVGVRGEDGSRCLLKVTRSRHGRAQLERQTATLAALHADPRLGPTRLLLPRVLATGEINRASWVLETRLGGDDGRVALTDPRHRGAFRDAALAAITELHRRTAVAVEVGDTGITRWVRRPAAVVLPVLRGADRATLDALVAALDLRLRGRRLADGWVHGDFTPDNVLWDPAQGVTGVVDWCQSDPDGLPVLDLVSFLLTFAAAVNRAELGTVVLRWIDDDVRHPSLDEAQLVLDCDPLDPGTLALLAWLRHIATNIAKSPRYAANPVWMRRNVHAVLRHWYRSPRRHPLAPVQPE